MLLSVSPSSITYGSSEKLGPLASVTWGGAAVATTRRLLEDLRAGRGQRPRRAVRLGEPAALGREGLEPQQLPDLLGGGHGVLRVACAARIADPARAAPLVYDAAAGRPRPATDAARPEGEGCRTAGSSSRGARSGSRGAATASARPTRRSSWACRRGWTSRSSGGRSAVRRRTARRTGRCGAARDWSRRRALSTSATPASAWRPCASSTARDAGCAPASTASATTAASCSR